MKLARLLALLCAATGWQAVAQWDTSGNGMLNGTYYFREVAYFNVEHRRAQRGGCTVRHHRLQRQRDLHDQLHGVRLRVRARNLRAVWPPHERHVLHRGLRLRIPFQPGIERRFRLRPGFPAGHFRRQQHGKRLQRSLHRRAAGFACADGRDLQGLLLAGGHGCREWHRLDVPGESGRREQPGKRVPHGIRLWLWLDRVHPDRGRGQILLQQRRRRGGVSEPIECHPDRRATSTCIFRRTATSFLAGRPKSWDFLVGIRTASGTPGFGGLYYQAGIDLSSAFDSYYGSLNANAGLAVGHQRVADVLDGYSSATPTAKHTRWRRMERTATPPS